MKRCRHKRLVLAMADFVVGQYKTETELIQEIENLEEIAKAGEMTLPQAHALNRARAELETIQNARSTLRRPWPIVKW